MKMPRTPEQEFLDQMTREYMVTWSDRQIRKAILIIDPACDPAPYIEHAISKGWLSKDGSRVLSAGFLTAARFLKR